MSVPGQQVDDRQRVRDASEIAAVIGEHVTLKPKGREYACLCPFHDDHNPSMSVVPHKQILLRDEAMLHRVQDPCGGAHAVEVLTDRIGRAAFTTFQEIERRGGMLAALRDGFVQAMLEPSARRRQELYRTRARVLVGTTRFVDERFVEPATETPDTEALQAAHDRHLASRGSVPTVGDDLVAAAADGATVGEMIDATRGVTFHLPAHEFLDFSADGAAFEHLRELVSTTGLRVRPILGGVESWSRARLAFAKDCFTAGGFTVLDPIDAPPDGPIDTAEPAPDVVVLCSDDASYAALAPRVRHDGPVVIAGRRTDALADIDHSFLHLGADLYLALRTLYLECATGEEAS